MTETTRERWLSLQEAEARTSFSERTLRRRIADGSLKARRVGPRAIRIAESDLDAFMRGEK
ncbi:helix-turn-helix domain-containing protein [Gordonia sp. PP30]|nr:helix-turn-helix domain-containing protein [Gordonia sp. PP30]UQE75942.1 helix-turn-helix domain-containing protein [Gordonia sp. PP30]